MVRHHILQEEHTRCFQENFNRIYRRRLTKASLFLFCCVLVCSCQKIETEQTDISESVPIISIYGTGEGTIQRPFTPNDIIEGKYDNAETPVWVIGYVVGATYRTMNNAIFSDTTQYSSNILISLDSTCTRTDNCVPVELSNQKLQTSYSLPSYPMGFRKCLLIHGKPKAYFNKNGLRNIDEGHWMSGFDIATINPDIQKWDTINYSL